MSSVRPTSITRVVVESLSGVSHGFFIIFSIVFPSQRPFVFLLCVIECVCVCQYTSDFESVNSAQNSAEKKSLISWLCLRNAMDGDDLAKLNDELRTPLAKEVLRLD